MPCPLLFHFLEIDIIANQEFIISLECKIFRQFFKWSRFELFETHSTSHSRLSMHTPINSTDDDRYVERQTKNPTALGQTLSGSFMEGGSRKSRFKFSWKPCYSSEPTQFITIVKLTATRKHSVIQESCHSCPKASNQSRACNLVQVWHPL